MTILNRKKAPVVYDPARHVDTQLCATGKGWTWGIKAEKDDKVYLVRVKDAKDTAEWVVPPTKE